MSLTSPLQTYRKFKERARQAGMDGGGGAQSDDGASEDEAPDDADQEKRFRAALESPQARFSQIVAWLKVRKPGFRKYIFQQRRTACSCFFLLFVSRPSLKNVHPLHTRVSRSEQLEAISLTRPTR